GDDSVAERERALQTGHSPIVVHWRIKIARDQSEAERAEPDRDADAAAGTNQFAAVANLQSQINRGESADQTDDAQRRIDFSKKHTAPKADEKRGVKAVVAAEQNA